MTRKAEKKFPASQNPSAVEIEGDWISLKSRGKLIHPSPDILDKIKRYGRYFDTFHGETINMEPKPLLKLHEQICRSENLESDVDKYVASLYIKIRFFNRIKIINETTKAAENKEKFRRMKQTAQFMF